MECESHLHNVPKGAEKHFRVQVVSDEFEGKRVIEVGGKRSIHGLVEHMEKLAKGRGTALFHRLYQFFS